MSNENKYPNLASIRQEYAQQQLTEDSVLPDALAQFSAWMTQAINSQVLEPTAMVLSTASASGQPAARVVLLKGLDTGFVFYTNYSSRKGHDLHQNPKAALTFFWPQLERQIRVEGSIEKVSAQESDAYFSSRPRGSQLGAIVSPQSTTIGSRSELENALSELTQKTTAETPLQRPAHWGGYRLMANRIEFWQGRPSRLHDRLLYVLHDAKWAISRLAP